MSEINEAAARRAAWVLMLRRVVEKPLAALAAGELRASMPVEAVAGRQEDRATFTHLEALGRSVAGLAPWLEASGLSAEEAEQRDGLARLARGAIASAVDPESPDRLNFCEGRQPVVDAAFLAEGLVRAPNALWEPLDAVTKQRLLEAFRSSRRIRPGFNNWLLFAATVELALQRFSGSMDPMRVDYALRQHDQWYLGDGLYGDGPHNHWDYYNSFVIQPMLVDLVMMIGEMEPEWHRLREPILARAQRYAAVQERMIGLDGSFPALGRSLAYRCGAFHALAHMAWLKLLPEELPAAQAREALWAVISRTLEAPGTFDEQGWLRIGLCGHQPRLGEAYISTGSLYLCSTAFLPLGLPPSDEFWSGRSLPWTQQRVWSGEDVPADHAISS
jgi:hypothetical protein